MTINDFYYPVLLLCSDGFIEFLSSVDELTKGTAKAVKDGVYNNVIIADSAGNIRRVIGAKILHGIGLFWGYSLLGTRMVRIDITLSDEVPEISLDNLKKKILKSFHYEIDGLENRNAFKEDFKNADTLPEIMRIISTYLLP